MLGGAEGKARPVGRSRNDSPREAAAEALPEGAAGVLHRQRPRGLELDELSVLGPIFVLKLKWSPREFGRPLVAELWLYPDGSRILELSTKCTTTEPLQVAAEARAFLAQKGVDLSGEQQTKTKTALEFFADELSAGRSG